MVVAACVPGVLRRVGAVGGLDPHVGRLQIIDPRSSMRSSAVIVAVESRLRVAEVAGGPTVSHVTMVPSPNSRPRQLKIFLLSSLDLTTTGNLCTLSAGPLSDPCLFPTAASQWAPTCPSVHRAENMERRSKQAASSSSSSSSSSTGPPRAEPPPDRDDARISVLSPDPVMTS